MDFSKAFSAEGWNELVKFARRCFAIEGVGISLKRIDGRGVEISAEGANDPEHDWKVRCTPGLDADGKSVWLASIRPGVVNARDVYVSVRAADGTTSLAALTDDPAPQLVIPPGQWRNPLKTDQFITAEDGASITAGQAEGYPKFFDKLGVTPAFAGGNVDLSNLAESIAPPVDETRTRQIRAVDVVLSAPRLASRQITNIDALGTVSIDTTYDNTVVRDRGEKPFRIHLSSKWTEPGEPTAIDQLNGNAVEPTTDEHKLATIWIVSPPDAGPDDMPDGTWTPYPQHFEFYNLNHAGARHAAAAPQPPITLVTGLAGGLADAIFASLLQPVNEANARVEAYLGAANTRGLFYH